MGGNEYLVQQMIDRLIDTGFSAEDKLALDWGCTHLCKQDLSADVDTELLLSLLTPLHRERLPWLLATSLLYCGRYEDTVILSCPQQPSTKILLISMSNLPGSDPPIGCTPLGQACSRLAVFYRWDNPQPAIPAPQLRAPARKISESLALEKKMLSIVDVFDF